MKVKYRNQLEPKEFLALIDLAKHTMDTMVTVVMGEKMEKAKRKREDDEGIDDLFGDESEESYEESEEESEEVVRPAPTPIPFEMKKSEKTAPSEPKLTPQMLEKGKHYLAKLIYLWRVNFDRENTPQPDRGEELRQLAISMRGPLVLHYVNSMGGLTLACQEVWNDGIYDEDGEQIAIDLTESTGSVITAYQLTGTPRVIAENMQQVSSILFPPLASFLEYPNPLEIEC